MQERYTARVGPTLRQVHTEDEDFDHAANVKLIQRVRSGERSQMADWETTNPFLTAFDRMAHLLCAHKQPAPYIAASSQPIMSSIISITRSKRVKSAPYIPFAWRATFLTTPMMWRMQSLN